MSCLLAWSQSTWNLVVLKAEFIFIVFIYFMLVSVLPLCMSVHQMSALARGQKRMLDPTNWSYS